MFPPYDDNRPSALSAEERAFVKWAWNEPRLSAKDQRRLRALEARMIQNTRHGMPINQPPVRF